jgi:hypothetical protein
MWRVGWWLAVGAACLMPALPLLVTELPPLSDYPNHLARMWFLGTQTGDPVMAAMLAPRWALLPNLGADAVVPWLMRVLPVHVAGRLLLAVILILPVLGVVALSRVTFGVRSAWALGAALVTCNALFLLGFLNFGLSYGLAMLAAAGWFRWREVRPVATVLLGVLAACLLFFCHLAGLVFFLILVGACEAERWWEAGGRGLVRRGVSLALVVAGPAGLYAATALSDAGGEVIYAGLPRKGVLALYPVLNYDFWLDLGTGAAILGTLSLGLFTGRVVVPLRWRIAIVALALLFVVSPEILKGLAYVDSRFAVLLGFAIFAGVRPVRLPRGMAAGLCVAGALLLGARTAVVAAMWEQYGAEVADVRAVIAPIEPGARVLPVWLRPGGSAVGGAPVPRQLADGTMMDWHLPALVMLDRRAFWPYLFAIEGQQPVRWLGIYARLAEDLHGGAGAARYVSGAPLSAADRVDFPLWESWPERFDYVLLIQEGGAPIGLDGFGGDRLALVRQAPLAALFRVMGGGVLAAVP